MRDIVATLTMALLDGPFEEPLWSGFLDQLRLAVDADYATLVLRSPVGEFDESLYSISGGVTASKALETFGRFDDFHHPSKLEWAENGKPFSLVDMAERLGAEHPQFFAELASLGVRSALEVRIREPSGVDGWLAVVRNGPDFDDTARALLCQIAPIFSGVLRSYVASEQHRFAAHTAGEAVRRLQFGWIALDAAGQIVGADQFGENVLATSHVVGRDRNGKIEIKAATAQRELERVVALMAHEPQSRPRAISLRTDPWLDMLVVPARLKPLAAAGTAAAIAYVHSDNWSSSDREEQLAELFSLTRSEGRLALALCRGKTITEAAVELGVTVQSARTYSKSIFAKTGARGQPDLVRIIMGSILALAPEV